MIDLSGVPIVDHHAHALRKSAGPMSLDVFQGFFSESPDPVIKARYVPDTIMWLWAIREPGVSPQGNPSAPLEDSKSLTVPARGWLVRLG